MSITPQSKCCPKCGGPIPAEAPQGLCPRCLFMQASIITEAGKDAPSKSAPPRQEELAVAFPQLEVLGLIGQGGMGFVFKARQPKLDRFVALKILPASLAADPAFAERFTREGRMLARLSHPNIVAIHDFGQANGFFYLLMEFVDGVNLRQAMKVGRFTPAQALAVVPKICEALQFAHNEGVLHRDIKPENILLNSKGRVKIADFGIAKLVGADMAAFGVPPSGGLDRLKPGLQTAPANLTETGKALGTPQYMAPEQIEHPQDVDQRADIYSLGVVFYEMLTGELPLGRFAPPSEKSTVDPRVDEVVLRALEKERERRTQTAGEVRTQVETIAAMPELGSSRRGEARSASARPNAEWGKRMPLLSPLTSPDVRDICAHLTKAESNRVSLFGLLIGVWVVAAVNGIPFLIKSFPSPGNWIVGTVLGIIFFVTLPMLSSIGRQFLCSTAWAKEQGFEPEHLKLYSLRGNNLWKGLAILLVLLSLALVQHEAITRYLGLSALTKPNPAPERQQAGAAMSRALTQTQPGKTLVLQSAKNDGQRVSLTTMSALLPGETLVALTRLPNGQTEEKEADLTIYHAPTNSLIVSEMCWSFSDSFSPHEVESAVPQLRRNVVDRPVVLALGEPLALFSVTNQFGDALRGYLDFRRFVPTPPSDATGPAARVHGSVSLKPGLSMFYLCFFSATVPPGYRIEATATPSNRETTIYGRGFCSWNPPAAFPTSRNWDASRQLEDLAKQGPIDVYLGEPRQMFSLTNEAGEVYRAFFELVGPRPPAELPDHLALTGGSSATVPSLAPPAPEAKFVMDTVQFTRIRPEAGELFWGFKCFVPPGHLASILFVRWTNGVPQVDPGFSGYFKVGKGGGIDIPFCSLACYRIIKTLSWAGLNEDQRRQQLAAWNYPESSGVTNAVRWDVNIGLGFTSSCWKEMPPYRGVKFLLPQSVRSGHQRAVRLIDFDTPESKGSQGQSGVELRIFLEPLKSPPIRMVANEVNHTNYISGTGLVGTMEGALKAIREWPTDP